MGPHPRVRPAPNPGGTPLTEPGSNPSQLGDVAADPPTRADRRLAEIELLVAGEHSDPHCLLGIHVEEGTLLLRALRPGAEAVSARLPGGRTLPLAAIHPAGVFAGVLGPADAVSRDQPGAEGYRLEITWPDGNTTIAEDAYRFWPTVGDLDLHLAGEGRHQRLWERLGAHPISHQGVDGCAFAVWAPNARSVRLVGDFNRWDRAVNPMRSLGGSGVWELFLPGVGAGARYQFEVLGAGGGIVRKADPFAFATDRPPGQASVVTRSTYAWGDASWIEGRRARQAWREPMSIYECHLGSFRRVPQEGDRPLTYRELAVWLGDHVVDLGFTHVELLPPAEHPFGGSWGYQVSAYYAPSARYGTPDDFAFLVDSLHRRGVGVIIDWVPAHFPRDAWALAHFDGTALYEHEDPRLGAHPDWGTLVFNFARHEVRNFLVANALYWVEQFHVDGLRVDAVASMLYLDYSRKPGEWMANAHGGRENLEAIAFLRELNAVVPGRHPGVFVIAEESTSFPSVSRPVHLGGLGFALKWNMGWMHDTLDYFSKDPVHRRYQHNSLTFGLLYAWTENFLLPLSHDEVVHGKGSLLAKMPGDRWQRHANLRALLAWTWAHPGKQLVFMGAELAQDREWSHDRSLDWHLLDDPLHRANFDLVRTLNLLYRDRPALWELDSDPRGFSWIDANDADNNVASFLRFPSGGGRPLACIANLSPVVRHGYRVGLPEGGVWTEVLNTDAPLFGGSGVVNGAVDASGRGCHGQPGSAELVLPPLAVIWLEPARNPETVALGGLAVPRVDHGKWSTGAATSGTLRG